MCLWHSPFPGILSGPSKCSASAQSRAEVGNALGQQLMVVAGQISTPSHLRCISQSPQWGPRGSCPGTHTASATLLPSSWPPFFKRTCWNPLPDKLPACKSSSPHFRISFLGPTQAAAEQPRLVRAELPSIRSRQSCLSLRVSLGSHSTSQGPFPRHRSS